MKKERITNFIIFFSLAAIEAFIAFFVRDKFFRPYVGDVIVVAMIYYLVRTVFPRGIKFLALYIFLFSTAVEFMQLFGITKILSFGNALLEIMLGTTYSTADIICYAVGCIAVCIVESIRRKKLHK